MVGIALRLLVSYGVMICSLIINNRFVWEDPIMTTILQKGFVLLVMVACNFLILKQPIYWRIGFSGQRKWDLFLPYLFYGAGIIGLFLIERQADPVYALVLAIMVAIEEEFFFRGMLFGKLISSVPQKNRWILGAIFLSAVVFGVTHFLNLRVQPLVPTIEQVAQITIFGLVLAGLYLRTGSLLAPIALHFLLDFFTTYGSDLLSLSNDFPVYLVAAVAFFYVLMAGIIIFPNRKKQYPLIQRSRKTRNLDSSRN